MRFVLSLALLCSAAAVATAGEPMRLVSGPALSPDGEQVVFTWVGDLWSAASGGGPARRLTRHPGLDAYACFSPDGSEIAFSGDRGRGRQVFVIPAEGGEPEPITFDTNGFTVLGWFPDGEHLLVRGASDRYWRDSWRFYRISRTERRAPEMLFDAFGSDASISPDGKQILFTREGVSWWRKGYTGSRASQVWLADLGSGEIRLVRKEETGCRWPVWLPDGESFVFVGVRGGAFNLVRCDLLGGSARPLTGFDDDSVVAPTVSRDGKTFVFRHLFDLYRFRPGVDEKPVKLSLENPGEALGRPEERRDLERASEAAFTEDGLEVAFVAGGDLFVMDTVLREPVAVTSTAAEESEPVFLPDGSAILYVSAAGGQVDLRRVERADPDLYWWQSRDFRTTKVTDDPAVEALLSLSPDGKRIAYVRGRGDLVTADPDGKNEVVLVSAFNRPGYDWSPDSRWITYAVDDEDFNRDVWIVPADGSSPAVNVSKHPDNEWDPAFSPDGKILAFVGRRWDRESDIHYVWLRKEDEEASGRDRKIDEAIGKMKKVRKPKAPKKEEGAEKAEGGPSAKVEEAKKKPKEEDTFRIDFEDISERVHRISIPDTTEGGLFWSPDGHRLAFSAEIDGRRGLYTVRFPDSLKPKLLTTSVGSGPDWVKEGNEIRWVVGGVPAVTSASGRTTSYGFLARQTVDVAARYRAVFDEAWRIMRDRFYDSTLNHRNWDEIRRKYRTMAGACPDRASLDRVVSMMLGELNASHLGFSVRSEPAAGPRDDWAESTVHLGVRFDPEHRGPGLLISHVFRGGPAEKAGLAVGETILAIDGTPVDPALDPTLVLNLPPATEVELRVKGAGADGAERTVRYLPTNLRAVSGLLYEEWTRGNREKVHDLGGGKLGYVHIRGMNYPSLFEFEREIYAEGYGRDGLIIDVRENGGGFTADHLLTILTQPRHAFTVQRGGGPGYPQDRKVYATWNKPIVVLVNQNSFSNAEIFAHAIQTLGRGKLVGVPTAGGVISTGGTGILDIGYLRTPGRGWFVLPEGEDMERNGAVPEFVVWPEPGELPRGVDRQLEKAVEVLAEDVAEYESRPKPAPNYASERE